MSAASLVWRHLRTGAAAGAVVAVIVALLSFVAVIVPPAVSATLDDSTRYRLDALTPVQRDLSTFVPWGVPMLGPSIVASPQLAEEYVPVWGQWDAALQAILDAAPPVVRQTHADAEYFTRIGGRSAVGDHATQAVMDPYYASRIDLVEGRLPELTVTIAEWDRVLQEVVAGGRVNAFGQLVIGDADSDVALPAFEIILTPAAAASVGWAVGDTRVAGEADGWGLPLPFTLVGTYEPKDAADPYWSRLPGVLTPARGFYGDGIPFTRVTGLASPLAVRMLVGLAEAETAAWYPLLVDEVTAGNAETLLAALRGITGANQTVPGSGMPLSFSTGATAALESAAAQSATLISVLAMFAAGPVGVALAVLALGCRMIIERRRPAVARPAARRPGAVRARGSCGLSRASRASWSASSPPSSVPALPRPWPRGCCPPRHRAPCFRGPWPHCWR